METLRSRGGHASAHPGNPNAKNNHDLEDPHGHSHPASASSSSIDVDLWNAKLSDRRRQRREERKGTSASTSSSSGAGAATDPAGNVSSSPSAPNLQRRRKQLLRQRRDTKDHFQRSIYAVLICLLILFWILGFVVLTKHTQNNPGSAGKTANIASIRKSSLRNAVSSGVERLHSLRRQFEAVIPRTTRANEKVPGAVKGTAAGNEPRVPVGTTKTFKGNASEVIDMREMNAHLIFDDIDGGAWKQGFEIEPIPIAGGRPKPLRIFVVPHSHCDPGWIKTFDDYFQSRTKQILSSIIEALDGHPGRKFIWAEISYFEWWWKEQSPQVQDVTRRLLKDGQLEFVTGGWVQTDEANTQLFAMEIQLQEGHDFIRETFGDKFIPQYGWSIDPFGYSPTMAYLLHKYGFKAMLIQRVHYRIKKELAQLKQLEFMWRQTWDTPKGEHDIFTHVMPFYSYDIPHTCGPDPSVCCQFDFARMRGVTDFSQGCPWGKHPQTINAGNVKERALLLLDQYRKKANLYRSNVVIAPLGDDFRYRTIKEANAQYENYERIFDYINQNVDGVEISFGTLSEYFKASMGTFVPPILKGAFFTYSDRVQDYWSGYFTSRVFDKALDRQLERVLYAAGSLGADKLELQGPRRALSLFQHHDGVTGTAKTHVVEDYARRIHEAIRTCQDWSVQELLGRVTASADGSTTVEASALTGLASCWQSNSPRGMSQNLCGDAGPILVYNPLDTDQFCGSVKIPGLTADKVSLPCEIPGSVPLSTAEITFDPNTGLMTHPIKEEWMVWKVNAGGAYLFFPGTLNHFSDNDHSIEQGGYVVTTKYWKRTVVEKTELRNGSTAVVIDFIYETFLQASNEEWLVRFTDEGIVNEGVFHTDLNGFNFDTHHFRKDMPIQAQVFPMPTLASIQDAHRRMTVISEHAQGTASLQDGSIDIWLDRRLDQDDERGLEEGVTDNVPTRTRLRVLLEKDGYKPENPEFEITKFCKRMWKELNHPLEMYGRLSDGKLLPLPELKPVTSKTRVDAVEVSSSPYTSGRFVITPVYMVYKRVDYLEQAIDSLRNSDFPRDRVPIVISHDGHIDAMTDYVETIKSEFRVIQLFHPHACSEHPDTFPGNDPSLNKNYAGDSYGNLRDSKITCCKHHFTWMMNEVFATEELKDVHGFFFTEEDYVVAPTIYEAIQNGLEYIEDKPKYFGITLDPTEGFSFRSPPHRGWMEKRFVTGPMVVMRNMFEKVKENAREYCEFDEYNWDWSLVHLMGKGLLPHLVLVPRRIQVAHIGLEGGLHEGAIDQKKELRMKQMKDLKPFQVKPVAKEIYAFQNRKLVHDKGFGGWGHPADHHHCISLFGLKPRRTWAEALHLQ